MELLLTCEHGGNLIPENLEVYFKNAEADLRSHLGFDAGALDLMNYLQEIAAASFSSIYTRLAIDMNRSISSRNLFSKYTGGLEPELKRELIERYHMPFRSAVREYCMKSLRNNKKLLHLSIHTFTPELRGEKRNAHMGILYDPSRPDEKKTAAMLKRLMNEDDRTLKIRYNYPYRGTSNSHIRDLRREFPSSYSGIMIEVNQSLVDENKMNEEIKTILLSSVINILKTLP